MHFVTFSVVTVILLVCVWQSETSKACYKAKTCIHDAKEKCGMDENGTPRRFLDTCDLLEYNCYYDATFTKVKYESCAELPPLDEDDFGIPTPFEPGHAKVINKWWCWRAKYCHNHEGGKICAVDVREKRRRVFANLCSMVKENCHFHHDFTESVMYECELIDSVWRQVISD